ncbi:hypothetical protein NDK47_20410 [Brevibacillus ruminantium]|uniref:Permease n=1 Tax=Brevibacillus ruminantium TaxID=2950604 RepID=A0ABY4WGM9_9BACL|nr:hypothetical protein [Brevibacillus ruminantium]USG64489.1 hypothetical protein NDK47_20410 [Brevibacillus ruminantium]
MGRMMDRKQWYRLLGYFGYSLFFGFVLLLLLEVQGILKEQVGMTYRPLPLIMFSSLMPIALGILAAIPGFVRVYRMAGKWAYDWIRCLAIGLPAFVGAFYLVFYFSGSLGEFLPFKEVFLKSGTFLTQLSGFILGYTLLHSVGKKENGS